VIEARRAQLGFAEGLIAEEVTDLWEDWMWPVDQVLDDDQLLTTVYQATAPQKPGPRPVGHAGRSRSATAPAQAHPQLEL